MDGVWRIAPVEKYKQQEHLTTIVKRKTGRTFQREVDVVMPVFQAAWEHAQTAFANSGVPPGPCNVDILVQEYPRTDTVCFIFCTQIFGRELFVQAPFQLSKAQIADLTLRDLWHPLELAVH